MLSERIETQKTFNTILLHSALADMLRLSVPFQTIIGKLDQIPPVYSPTLITVGQVQEGVSAEQQLPKTKEVLSNSEFWGEVSSLLLEVLSKARQNFGHILEGQHVSF